MNSEFERGSIASAIEGNRKQIISEWLGLFYDDPYWEERYGDQGRVRVEEDMNYHLDNLIIAIRFNLPSSTTEHYHHTQNLLVNRGICTRFIVETLEGLKRSLARILPDNYPKIEPFLDAGLAGLAYQDPASRLLSEQAHSVADEVITKFTALPFEFSTDETFFKTRQREILLLISYLSDSMEKGSPEILTSFVDWLASFHTSKGLPRFILKKELSLLSKEITQQLPVTQARRMRSVVRRIQRDLDVSPTTL